MVRLSRQALKVGSCLNSYLPSSSGRVDHTHCKQAKLSHYAQNIWNPYLEQYYWDIAESSTVEASLSGSTLTM